MNVRSEIARLESRARRADGCSLCARGVGMKLAVVLERDEPYEPAALACRACGAVPPEPLVVVLDDGDTRDQGSGGDPSS